MVMKQSGYTPGPLRPPIGHGVPIDTGNNSAGDGGNGYFFGKLTVDSHAVFAPINTAQAGFHSTADAYQTNRVYFDQSANQIAGVGGDGGNGNVAVGGNVDVQGSASAVIANATVDAKLGFHGSASEVIATGSNSAGNGGEGYFFGAAIHEPVAVYKPINVAVAGPQSTAVAHQANDVEYHQGAIQVGGAGGNGGNSNVAKGGDVSKFGLGKASDYSLISSDVIATGSNSAGNGGDGYFHGSLVNVSYALFDPINIVVAKNNSSAHADQQNDVYFDQNVFQMAGVGGVGGNGNTALGGNVDTFSSAHGLIGSDVIVTGSNSAGNGGNGHFSGSLVNVDVAIYAPINIAVAGYNSAADAHQTNNVHFDQSAIQMAGIGGDGGHGNHALGGDFVLQLLENHHVLDHLA
jgi:hypothetical protein